MADAGLADADWLADAALLDVITAGAAFTLFLALHLVIWRRAGAERAGFVLMTALWLAALVLTLALAPALARASVRPLTVIAVDGALMAFYLHLYTGMLRSVSLRILGEMDVAGGAMTRAEVDRVYSPTAMLESRLDWLVERGWIRAGGGASESPSEGPSYTLTDAGRRLLAVRRPLARWLVEGPTG